MPEPYNYAAILQAGKDLFPDIVNEGLKQQLLAAQVQGTQAQAADTFQQSRQRKAALDQDEAYQGALDQYLVDPTPEGALRLITRFPDRAKEVKSGWDTLDKGRQAIDLRQMSEIYSAAKNGRYDLAAKNMRARVEADKAADGQADPQDEAILAALESGNPVEQKAALGMIGVGVAAITGPEHFGATYGQLTEDKKPFTLGPGDTRYDADGKVVVESPYKPQIITDPATGQQLEYTPGQGGGGQSGGGGGVPRGIRNNNPGNLEFGPMAKTFGATGSDGRFAVFPSMEAGIKAQEALLLGKGYHAGGRNTISSIIGKYAPSTDGNDVGSYAAFVSKATGIPVDRALSKDEVRVVAKAMRDFENGQDTGNAGSNIRILTAGKPITPSETRVVNGETLYKINGKWMRRKTRG